MKKNKAKALYVHIPFCEAICDYCDFQKLQYFRNLAVPYIDRLIEQLHSEVKGDVNTIYVGGGTPTSLDDDLFEKLLSALSKYHKSDFEFTVECNPESLDINKVKLLKKYGVNRVSIGVESTDDKILKAINRRHSFIDVANAVKLLRENSISNINLDLILGLPNVSLKMMEKDIYNILSLHPDHISCYSLTVHEHTVFYINGIEPPSEDFAYDAYKLINGILSKEDYTHYEVSNWCKPNRQSEHNLCYWRNDEYYGVGLGASGYIDNVRYKNTTNLDKYLKGENIKETEKIIAKDKAEYQIMLNLRTFEGLNLLKFKDEYGFDLYKDKKEVVDSFIKGGYLEKNGDVIIATFDGMMILDKIILELI